MTNCWYIYGAGGLGVETMDILQHVLSVNAVSQNFKCIFVDDNRSSDDLLGFPICSLDDCVSGSNVTIAVGEPRIRSLLAERAEKAGLVISALVSPSAQVSASAKIEVGAIIAPFCSVQARAHVGRNVAVNTMSIIGHDVIVHENAVISSQVNLGGAVDIGSHAYIGMAASIQEQLVVGAWSIVGMGSVVYQDIPSEVIALGNPARVSRRNETRTVFRKK